MKIANGHEIIQLFERFSPKGLAMEGDKIGLQIGRLNKKIDRIMIALDVLEEVIDEAIEKKCSAHYCSSSSNFSAAKKSAYRYNSGKND